MSSIDIKTLLSKLEQEKLNIIDIRTNYEYIQGRIPTAQNIDKLVLLRMPEKYLDKTKTYYIYCQSGHSSERLVERLNTLGYNTVNIIGGYNNYLLRN